MEIKVTLHRGDYWAPASIANADRIKIEVVSPYITEIILEHLAEIIGEAIGRGLDSRKSISDNNGKSYK